MVKVSRSAVIIMGLVTLVGCVSTATSISGSQRLVSAEPIQTEFTVPMTPVSGVAPVLWSPATATGHEKEYLGYVLLNSGRKCQEFTNRLSVAQRGVDTSFDILTVILSALATAFTPLSTVHGLTAAATISTGTKAAINADVYAKATAALILQEINQTYYADIDNYRTELSKTQDVGIIPTIELSKIEAIHRECSLDAAIASLSQSQAAASASLAAISGAFAGASAARQQGLSPEAGAIAGAAAGAAAGASGMTAAPEAAAKQGAAAGENAVDRQPQPQDRGPARVQLRLNRCSCLARPQRHAALSCRPRQPSKKTRCRRPHRIDGHRKSHHVWTWGRSSPLPAPHCRLNSSPAGRRSVALYESLATWQDYRPSRRRWACRRQSLLSSACGEIF